MKAHFGDVYCLSIPNYSRIADWLLRWLQNFETGIIRLKSN